MKLKATSGYCPWDPPLPSPTLPGTCQRGAPSEQPWQTPSNKGRGHGWACRGGPPTRAWAWEARPITPQKWLRGTDTRIRAGLGYTEKRAKQRSRKGRAREREERERRSGQRRKGGRERRTNRSRLPRTPWRACDPARPRSAPPP